MTAYVILDIDVQDPLTYQEYVALVPATVTAYGGKYLARGGRKNSKGNGSPGGW